MFTLKVGLMVRNNTGLLAISTRIVITGGTKSEI